MATKPNPYNRLDPYTQALALYDSAIPYEIPEDNPYREGTIGHWNGAHNVDGSCAVCLRHLG